MPLFMDRHDISGDVGAEDIARLHQEDLKIQDQFGCRGLTYWFDGKRMTAFCLIEANDAEAIRRMHDKAHGQVPHRVIEVDAGIVESFLGRIEDPEKTQHTDLLIINEPAFRVIMLIESGQLELIERGTSGFRKAWQHYHNRVAGLLYGYEGKIVKQRNEGYLVSFRSASHAVQAALKIREEFEILRGEVRDQRMSINIGLSTGVPVTEKELIFEDAIKLAERMCGIVHGELVVTQEVKELYEGANIHGISTDVMVLTKADEAFLTGLMDYTESVWNVVDVKVDDFNGPLGYSKSQFYRKMIWLTGKSPNTFIRDYRLKEALKLLQSNAGNVSEIAYETGFTSPSYFTKCFQRKYGLSPTEFSNLQPVHQVAD